MVDSLIISIDTSNGKDNTVLIVGRKTVGQQVEIVNAFQGEDLKAIDVKLLREKGRLDD